MVCARHPADIHLMPRPDRHATLISQLDDASQTALFRITCNKKL
jgi:hypothetical protein